MAALTTILAVGSLAIGAASAVQANEARNEAEFNAKQAAERDKIARGEQKAGNAQQAAMERRLQIPADRIRRAKILQSSENTGAAGSSGEIGAVDSLSTSLSSNIGQNLGSIQRANTISELAQQSADFKSAAQSSLTDAQQAESIFGLSTSIFNAVDGTAKIKQAFK
jgi:hypothetical protein